MTQPLLNRSIERWRGCDPDAMAYHQSQAAIKFAFEDAKHDILALEAIIRGLVNNEGIEPLSYLNKGIGSATGAGKRWLAAQSVIARATA